ncbi:MULTISPECIES: SGNH/GDSL hydrolase family protein [unclassified Crossiella]|uniref:SGNH/GDSL hydrolase family protein n=1 Tax=unclassified Crossiella TaxID=2620835 RepID=UPI001FFF25A5|nr:MULTISPECIES: SGNH/GDSL hydrolase family protein [unclassified Crossiella]MCK2240855.1 SGNH/GDSL hydrolase family protein [Crossiella sp. S99.2]MCK2254001.1 SGNH/GDSL hydrolase family protein [Crossiella sp. S99.1]
MSVGIAGRLTTIGAVAVAAAALFASGAEAAVRQVRHYVALGDSFTSGPLIPLPRLNPLGCARSTENYPSLLNRRIRPARFTDISCGAADTTNMTQPQSVPLGRNPAQFSALTKDTDLVSVSIGGNDFSVFGETISTCASLRASDPGGAPCAKKFGDELSKRIGQTEGRVVAVLRGIRERAPKARVLVVGYPRIAPPSGTCPNTLPFATGDYPFLDGVEQQLNAALRRAAGATGDTYVDTYGPSLGHDACQRRGVAWVNGQHTDLLAAASYHPFRTGMVGMADAVQRALTTRIRT